MLRLNNAVSCGTTALFSRRLSWLTPRMSCPSISTHPDSTSSRRWMRQSRWICRHRRTLRCPPLACQELQVQSLQHCGLLGIGNRTSSKQTSPSAKASSTSASTMACGCSMICKISGNGAQLPGGVQQGLRRIARAMPDAEGQHTDQYHIACTHRTGTPGNALGCPQGQANATRCALVSAENQRTRANKKPASLVGDAGMATIRQRYSVTAPPEMVSKAPDV